VVHFLRFSIGQAVEGLWRNRVMSLAATITMVLMLVLLSSLVIVLAGMQAGLSFIESKVEVRAELSAGAPQERVDALGARIGALPEVASVTYISKEQALEEFREQRRQAGEPDLTEYAGYNPFPAQLSIRLRDPRRSSQTISTLQAETGIVSRIIEPQQTIDRLVNLTALLRTIGLAVLALVGMTVLLIVVNSIRMALMSRAQEIEIMRLVGASDAYVRWPFIVEGLLVGLVGALVTLGLLLLASGPIVGLADAIAGQVPVGFGESLTTQLTILVFAAGLGLGGLGAWISVRAYLRRT
jgi:cell division transport system permease protein